MTIPDFSEEEKVWEKGFEYVIGIDEVGRGAFAGPLVAGAVIFKKDTAIELLEGVNDSKLLKPQKRSSLAKIINKLCLCSQVVSIPVPTINKVGIGKANQLAFRRVIFKIIKSLENDNCLPAGKAGKLENPKRSYFVLVDGFHIKYLRGIGLKNQKAIIKGDRKSISIASASIIAKVHRDRIMKNLSKKYPQYGFGKNKGYGTKFHQNAIKKFGISRIHRKNFTPCKGYIDKI